MESINKGLEVVILVLNGFSIFVLVWGVISAMKNFAVARIINRTKMDVIRENTTIKNAMGSYILLGLEILIAADIIASILHPDLQDILRLAAVVVIRTIISYFLNKEIETASDQHYDVSVKAKERIENRYPEG